MEIVSYRVGVLLLVLCALVHHSVAISFHLDPDSRKCLREEVHSDVLVVGEYSLNEVHGQKTNIEVCEVYPPLCVWSGLVQDM